MHLSVTPFIRKDAIQKTGKTSIYLRIIYKRKPKSVSLGIYINPQNWNDLKKEVNKSEPMAATINLLIKSKITNLLKKHYDNDINNKQFSYSTILRVVKGIDSMDFKAYADKQLKERPVQKQSKKPLQTLINTVVSFKPTLQLSDIDVSFLNSFKSYLQFKKLADNTIIGMMVRLKTFVCYAIKDGLIQLNAFDSFKLGTQKPKQQYLNKDELNYILNKLPNATGIDKKVLTQFCFSCFTGMRHSDLMALDYSMLRKNDDNFYFEFNQVKTKDHVIVPLSKNVLQWLDVEKKSGRVFSVNTNQYYNRSLKSALLSIDFKKSVSSHVARHTFITIGLQNGMQKEMIGKIAGHKKSATTDGYVHLQTADLFKELQKWNTSPAGGG